VSATALLHVAAAYGFLLLIAGAPIGSKFRGGWRVIVIFLATGCVLVNLAASVIAIAAGADTDWRVLAEYGQRAGSPMLYEPIADGPYRYSPLYAWLLLPLAWMGHWGFAAIHVAVIPLFRDWRVVSLLLIGWPFWFDAVNGNVLVFVLLAAWWSLRGNRWGTLAFLEIFLLMPRPIILPLVVHILWKRPEWRWPFAGLLVMNVGLVATTGLADEWLGALVATSDMLAHPLNFGPSRYVGLAWLPIGAALAGWLLWRGKIGLACLAISPYLIPYYWLFALLELPHGTAAPMRFPALAYSAKRAILVPVTAPLVGLRRLRP